MIENLQDKITALVMSEAGTLITLETIFKKAVGELTTSALLTAWSIIDLFEKNIVSSRKADLRDRLLELAQTFGKENKTGSFVLPVDDGKITKTKRSGTLKYDISKLELVLFDKKERGLLSEDNIRRVLVLEIKTTVNEDALTEYVASGVLSIEELKQVTSMGEPTWALNVVKPSSVNKLFGG